MPSPTLQRRPTCCPTCERRGTGRWRRCSASTGARSAYAPTGHRPGEVNGSGRHASCTVMEALGAVVVTTGSSEVFATDALRRVYVAEFARLVGLARLLVDRRD